MKAGKKMVHIRARLAEDQRIRKNLREGLLPTDGDILATDEASGETVIIK